MLFQMENFYLKYFFYRFPQNPLLSLYILDFRIKFLIFVFTIFTELKFIQD